jgi:hypothetical protein
MTRKKQNILRKESTKLALKFSGETLLGMFKMSNEYLLKVWEEKCGIRYYR